MKLVVPSVVLTCAKVRHYSIVARGEHWAG
jgi:hypothetical protein